MNFITKITSPTNSASPTKASGKPSSRSVSSPTHGAKLDSSVEEANTRDITATKAEKLKVENLDEIEQKDSWLTLDDKVSVSDDDDDSESSDNTYTSIFSKEKLQSVRKKWAGKITKKLNSPPKQPYKNLGDGSKEPQDSAVSTAKDHPKGSPSVTSIDEPSPKHQSEGGDVANHVDPIATEEESKGAEDAPTFKSSDTNVVDPPAVVVDPPVVVLKKQTQWRFAIDQATGRTYYYIRGTSKVTWEKPPEMSD